MYRHFDADSAVRAQAIHLSVEESKQETLALRSQTMAAQETLDRIETLSESIASMSIRRQASSASIQGESSQSQDQNALPPPSALQAPSPEAQAFEGSELGPPPDPDLTSSSLLTRCKASGVAQTHAVRNLRRTVSSAAPSIPPFISLSTPRICALCFGSRVFSRSLDVHGHQYLAIIQLLNQH